MKTPKNTPPAKAQAKPASSPPQQQFTQQWQGPLPPPAALAQFNQIIPNGAARIMEMVEKEQAHRQAFEMAGLAATRNDTRRGHLIGGAIALSAIGGAVLVVYLGGHWSVSVALVSLPVAGIIDKVLGRSKPK